MIKVNLKNFTISNDQPFVLIAGPCVIEDEKHSLLMVEKINNICQKVFHFKPGHYWNSKTETYTRYYNYNYKVVNYNSSVDEKIKYYLPIYIYLLPLN